PADQRPAAERAGRFLTSWRAVKDRLPIARLLGAVFADSGYDAAMQFEFLGDRKLANLWKLVDLARSFDRTGLFGLHEFTDRLGDWQEDLRVLYVACTRARDLLILSAGLPEPLPEAVAGLPTGVPAKAANHWTLMLAERFDLRTGRCVAVDVKPEDAPAVR